jgi:hypothetical protein
MDEQTLTTSEDQDIDIVNRRKKTFRRTMRPWYVGVSTVFMIVAAYWLVLYRITWSVEWAFLAMCSTLTAGVVSSIDLLGRRKHFSRDKDNLPIYEIGLVFISIAFTSLLFFRTLAH